MLQPIIAKMVFEQPINLQNQDILHVACMSFPALFRKLLDFRKANHSTENSAGNSGMKIKWSGNFQEKKLDISRKDDGDAHSIKETLQNLSTYMSINTTYS